MNNRNLSTPLTRSLLFIFLAILQLSCGRQVTSGNSENSFDSSSRLPVNIIEQEAETPKDIATCNKKESSYFTAHLGLFYDQTNVYHPEYIRLYLPKIHADFAKSNFQIVLRKWKASEQGETFQDNTPLQFRAERLGDHSPVTGYMNALHWETLSSELQKTISTNYTLSEAFSKFSFVVDLKDLSGTFDVLKFSLYQDGNWVEDWNMLIPAFYAHPKAYAENQNGVLAKFHPFYGFEDSSFDAAHFAGVLNGYCF